MPTHAEIAAKLLRDAASFFNTLGEQNESLQDQMNENAQVFERVATLVETDPSGELEEGEEGEVGEDAAEGSAGQQ